MAGWFTDLAGTPHGTRHKTFQNSTTIYVNRLYKQPVDIRNALLLCIGNSRT